MSCASRPVATEIGCYCITLRSVQRSQLSKPAPLKIRIDIWLHRARLFKSRTQATGACREGKVLVNDRFADAGDTVQEGDSVKVRFRGIYRVYRVVEAADVNLSKQDAKRMYEDITSPETAGKFRLMDEADRAWRASKHEGPRPAKKSRRDLDRVRGR